MTNCHTMRPCPRQPNAKLSGSSSPLHSLAPASVQQESSASNAPSRPEIHAPRAAPNARSQNKSPLSIPPSLQEKPRQPKNRRPKPTHRPHVLVVRVRHFPRSRLHHRSPSMSTSRRPPNSNGCHESDPAWRPELSQTAIRSVPSGHWKRCSVTSVASGPPRPSCSSHW